MIYKTRFIFLAALLLSFGALAKSFHCGGGDGPTPFVDITNSFNDQVQTIDSVSGVNEFLFWENSNQVVYRNGSNEVRGVSLDSTDGAPAQTVYSTSSVPISTLTDPFERFILTASEGWMLDTKNESWFQFSQKSDLQHLFWNADFLYSVEHINNSGTDTYNFYRYHVGDSAPVKVCKLTGPVDSNGPLQLGHGHNFPNVYFWDSATSSNGDTSALNVYQYDVTACILSDPDSFDDVRGPVRDVFYFDTMGSMAISVTDPIYPDENLFWVTPQGCTYIDVNQDVPIVPNYKQPALASFDPANGLVLYFMNSQTKVTLLGGFPISQLEAGDLYLDDAGQRLFISPLFSEEKSKWLLDVKLPSESLVKPSLSRAFAK